MSARNAGLREHHGEVIGTAAWAPIVDRETWEATCSLVRSRRSTATGRPARTNALAGMLRCPCGAVMVAGSTGKRRPGVYAYTCRVPGSGHVSVSATVAENEATAALWAALGVREAELAVEVHTAAEASVDGSTVSDAVRGLDTARARTEELEAMFAEGELTRPEYVRMRSRARERLDAAETALRTVATVPTELPRLGDVRAVWDDLTPDEQRTIYRSVFAGFRVTAGGGRWSTVASRLVPLTYPE